MHELEPVFNPRSIAVVGASRREGTIGQQVTKNLIEGGFPGPIYPINPGATEILGLKAYPSIGEVPGPVDAAVYCVPADKVLDVARQCAKVGVKGHIVITSGFAEVGNKKDEEELMKIARESGGRVIGPNIVGIMSNPGKANASFAPVLPFNGKTALISQSGALIIALDTVTFVRRFGVTSMISLGNMADVDFADCIEYYAQDPNTKCIALYVEGAKNGFKFMQAGRWAGKPIVVLKAGVSAHGAAAAASHTGSLAGSVKVYQAACNQAHMIWATDLDDMLNKSQALAMQPPLKGDNVVIITNGGGIGVLGTDAAERHGIPLQTAPADVQAVFRKFMPDFGSPKNPVDITGGSGVAGYEGAIEAALKSPWVNGIGVFYCETAVTKATEIADALLKKVKESGVTDKPVIACFVGGAGSVEAGKVLLDASVPYFDCPNKAMAAFAALRQAARFDEVGCKPDFEPYTDVDKNKAKQIIATARAAGRKALTEPEAKGPVRLLPPAGDQVQPGEDRGRRGPYGSRDRLPRRPEDRVARHPAQERRRRGAGEPEGYRGRPHGLPDGPRERQEVQSGRRDPRDPGLRDGAAGQRGHLRIGERLHVRPDRHVRPGRGLCRGPEGRHLPRSPHFHRLRPGDAARDQGLPHAPGGARREAPGPGGAGRRDQPAEPTGGRPRRRDRRDRRQPDPAVRRRARAVAWSTRGSS